MASLKKLGLQDHLTRILLQHSKEARESVLHIVIMTEDLSSIAVPDVFPDTQRICSHAVYEPLGVVVQRDLGRLAFR